MSIITKLWKQLILHCRVFRMLAKKRLSTLLVILSTSVVVASRYFYPDFNILRIPIRIYFDRTDLIWKEKFFQVSIDSRFATNFQKFVSDVRSVFVFLSSPIERDRKMGTPTTKAIRNKSNLFISFSRKISQIKSGDPQVLLGLCSAAESLVNSK